MSMLKVENLSVHYGMIQAVRDVSFEVNEGEVVPLSVPMVLVRQLFSVPCLVWLDRVQEKLNFLGQEIQKNASSENRGRWSFTSTRRTPRLPWLDCYGKS